MIQELKKAIAKHGISKVTKELGFRSMSTIRNWLQMDQVPPIRHDQVKAALKRLK